MSNIYKLDEYRKSRKLVKVPVESTPVPSYMMFSVLELMRISTQVTEVIQTRELSTSEIYEALEVFKALYIKAATPVMKKLAAEKIYRLQAMLNEPPRPA